MRFKTQQPTAFSTLSLSASSRIKDWMKCDSSSFPLHFNTATQPSHCIVWFLNPKPTTMSWGKDAPAAIAATCIERISFWGFCGEILLSVVCESDRVDEAAASR